MAQKADEDCGRRMLRQTEATDCTVAVDIGKDYQYFADKLLQCAKKAESVQLRRVNSRVIKATNKLLEKSRKGVITVT